MKTPSKRGIQKTAEVTGDIIGNKIVDKMTSVRKRLLRITKWRNGSTKKDKHLQTKCNKLMKY